MDLTYFQLYRNTPMVDFGNTIHFESNLHRDNYFMNEMTEEFETIKFEAPFNYIKDRSSVNVPYPYRRMNGVNYAMFKTDKDPTIYYAHVSSVEYVNERVSRVNLLIDPVMTYTQGDVLENIQPVEIIRESLDHANYRHRLNELRNNDDVIKTHTKAYFEEESLVFEDFIVLLETTVDLSEHFGSVNNPKIKSSSGSTVDGITSPKDLYYTSREDFPKVMGYLSIFPWIVQNITKATMIPAEFFEGRIVRDRVAINGYEEAKALGLYRLGDKIAQSEFNAVLEKVHEKFNRNALELFEMYGLDPKQDAHLLRNEYGTVEIYTYKGESLFLDLGKLDIKSGLGLSFWVNMIAGFENELRIFPSSYNIGDNNEDYEEVSDIIIGGDLNNSIGLTGFDDMPMTVDNYRMSLASTANQRALNEDRLLTSRLTNIVAPDTNLADRLMEGFNLITNVTSLSGLGNKINEEYEYYREQKAQEMDLALTGNSISNQTYSNAFLIRTNKYGFHLKFSKPSQAELFRVKQYYKLFGFDGGGRFGPPISMTSNTIANYLQFKGSWHLRNVPPALMDILKIRMEMGVRFWHNNGTSNPMSQRIIYNEIKQVGGE